MSITNFAQEAFGSVSNGSLVPRQKFNFTILLDIHDRASIEFTRVQSSTVPGFSMDTIIANQYNNKRVIQTKLNYDPVTIVFYDTFDNQFHNLMQRYLKHYFNTGEGIGKRTTLDYNETIDDLFVTDYGFTPNSTRYFFPSIRLIQRGYKDEQRVTTLKNPIITAIQGDQLDYSDSQPVLYTVTFQPESVQTDNETLNSAD